MKTPTKAALAAALLFASANVADAGSRRYCSEPGLVNWHRQNPPNGVICQPRQYRPQPVYRPAYYPPKPVYHHPRHVVAPCGGSPCGGARPTGQPYVAPAVTNVQNGIRYTGNSCVRKDNSTGREGYQGNQLGCWRF